MTDHKAIREALAAHDMTGISMEDWCNACTPKAIRAILSDLDDSNKAYGLLFSEYSRLREKLEQATNKDTP